MRFGINLGGGNLPEESREGALAGRLEKARLAKRYGYHSLWTGAGYLNNDFHAMLLLARVAGEAPGLELGMVALLPLYHPVEDVCPCWFRVHYPRDLPTARRVDHVGACGCD